MRYLIILLLLGMAGLITSGCSYHLRGGKTAMPTEIKTLILDTSDPYGPLVRAVQKQLRLNNIKVIYNAGQHANLTSLRLQVENIGRNTTSVFQDGKAAEYSMVMTANAQVMVPNNGIYPISVTIYRSFFDNPLAALAKNSEQQIIIDEMRNQVAQQLVRKLLTMHSSKNKPVIKTLNHKYSEVDDYTQ